MTLLKESITKHCPDDLLTPEERSRNATGNIFMFSYDAAVHDTVPSCNRDLGIPDILRCHSRVDIFKRRVSILNPFKSQLIQGTRIPFPGFPSLNVLPFRSHELVSIGINCFGFASKYPTMVLSLQSVPQQLGAKDIASKLLGMNSFINWPLMHEAKVVAVSDADCIVRLVNRKPKIRHFTDKERDEWETQSSTIAAQYMSGIGIPGSGGIDIGEIKIRLKMLPLQGMKTNPSDGSTTKVFGTEEADIPLQMVLRTSPAPDPRFEMHGPMTMNDLFPTNSRVIITKGKYRGCMGSILGIVEGDKVGVSVTVIPPEPPFGLAIVKSIQESYLSAKEIADILRLNPVAVAKVTASLYFKPGNFDLGLNLAYKGRFYVLGYSRRRFLGNVKGRKFSTEVDAWKTGDSVLVVGSKRHLGGDTGDDETTENYIWEYSPKAVRVIAAYMQQFPALFRAIDNNPNDRFYEAKVLGPSGSQSLGKIRDWLNNVETAKLPRIPCTTLAMPYSAVKAVQHAADVRVSHLDKIGPFKAVHVKVPSSALYREASTAVVDVLKSSDYKCLHPELGIRVVNLCASGVPFGARGTVVAVHDAVSGCVEVVMDEEFIGGSTLQGSCSQFRGKLCVWNHLLTISSSDDKDVAENMVPSRSLNDSIEDSVKDALRNKSTTGGRKTDTTVEPSDSRSSVVVSPTKSRARTDGASLQQPGKWREALGPDRNDKGFRESRTENLNGLELWKRHLLTGIHSDMEIITAKNPQINKVDNAAEVVGVQAKSKVDNTTELKAMLGVKPDDKSKLLKNVLGVGMSASSNATFKLGAQTDAKVGHATELKAMLGVQDDEKSKMLKNVLGVGMSTSNTSSIKSLAIMECEDNTTVGDRPVDVFSWKQASTELNNIRDAYNLSSDHHKDPSMNKASDVLLQMMACSSSPPLLVPLPQPVLHANIKPSFNFAYVPEGQSMNETVIPVAAPRLQSQAQHMYHPIPGNGHFHTNFTSEGGQQKRSNNHEANLGSSIEQAPSQAVEGKKTSTTAVSMKNLLIPTSTIRASVPKNKKVTHK